MSETSLDMTDTLAPKSDQLNADDLISGPRTVTITGVSRGDDDQPVNITTAEFGEGRPYKPCKSMRRVLVHAWGPDASKYVGRRLTLFNDQKVKWGGQDVGGIRIKAMSHIQGRLTVALTVTRGKRAPFTVEPLPDEPEQIARDETPVTPPQLQKLSILRQREGYTDDEDGRTDWFRWVQINTGRLVGTNKDLTKAEASVLIDVLESAEGEAAK
jgi:hypothetical protein